MSASDGIYVLHTETEKGPEYRVKYCGAGIDDIYGDFNDDTFKYDGDLNKIKATFEDAKVFLTLDEALEYAEALSHDYEYLEEGISLINDFQHYGFIFEGQWPESESEEKQKR